MPIWLQHLSALTLVAICGVVVAWNAFRSLRGVGKLGRCCAKGCDAASVSSQPASNHVRFFPSDSLRRRR